MKCPVSLAKTCIQHMTVAHFYLVVSGTYWGSSEFKMSGSVAKRSLLSILNPKPTFSVHECKFVDAMQTMLF